MFIDNNWYSHRKILANYCNIKDKPAYASIQHGWFRILDQEIKSLKVSKIPKSTFLCWSKRMEEIYKKNNPNKNIVAIGAPFIYLYDDNKPDIKIERNVLVFPPHTGELENKPSNFTKHKELINHVSNLYTGPYSACLFYQDMKKDIIKIYKEKNWKIFCCGDRKNLKFLENFIKIVSLHENIIVCEMTSAYLYALYMKKDVKIINEFNKTYVHRNVHGQEIDEDSWIVYKDLYPFLSSNNFEEKIKYAKLELGCENKKTKTEIIKLMGWDSFLKSFLSKLIFYSRSQIK